MSKQPSQSSSKKSNIRPNPLYEDITDEMPPLFKVKTSSYKSQLSEHKENKPYNGSPKMVEEETTKEIDQKVKPTQTLQSAEEAKNEEEPVPIEETDLLKPSSLITKTAEIPKGKRTASVTKDNVTTQSIRFKSRSKSRSRSRSKTAEKLTKVKEVVEKKETDTVEKKENEKIDLPKKENQEIANPSEREKIEEEKKKAIENGNEEKATDSEQNV